MKFKCKFFSTKWIIKVKWVLSSNISREKFLHRFSFYKEDKPIIHLTKLTNFSEYNWTKEKLQEILNFAIFCLLPLQRRLSYYLLPNTWINKISGRKGTMGC